MTSLILRVQAAEHHFPSCRLARASYKPKSDTVRLEAAGVAFIDENGGGPGVRLRTRQGKRPSRIPGGGAL